MLNQARTWLEHDDVLRASFLSGIVIVTCEQQVDNATSAMSTTQFPDAWNTSWWTVLPSDSSPDLQSGPHVVAHGRLHKAYRIYDDVNEAFVMATKPQIAPG